MHRNTRIAISIVGVLVTTAMLSFGVAAASVYRAGSVAVAVRSAGPDPVDLSFRVPAALVELAAALLPREVCSRIPADARVYSGAAREALAGLAAASDGVLLEVTSPRESVTIEKTGGSLLFHVRSENEEVRVTLPLRAAAHAVERIERLCAGS